MFLDASSTDCNAMRVFHAPRYDQNVISQAFPIPDAGRGVVEAEQGVPSLQVQCQGPAQGRNEGVQRTTKPAALTVRECCASLNFWLLFTVFGVGTGVGLMFVNNLGKSPYVARYVCTCAARYD